MSGTKTQQHSGHALDLSICSDMRRALSRAYDLGWEDASLGLLPRLGKNILWYVKADAMSPPYRRAALKAAYTAGQLNSLRHH